LSLFNSAKYFFIPQDGVTPAVVRDDPIRDKSQHDIQQLGNKSIPLLLKEIIDQRNVIYGRHFFKPGFDWGEYVDRHTGEYQYESRYHIPISTCFSLLANTAAGKEFERKKYSCEAEELQAWLVWWQTNKIKYKFAFEGTDRFKNVSIEPKACQSCQIINGLLNVDAEFSDFKTYKALLEMVAAEAGTKVSVCVNLAGVFIPQKRIVHYKEMTFDEFVYVITRDKITKGPGSAWAVFPGYAIPLHLRGDVYYFGECESVPSLK
jgi:hypothetical protein